MNDKIVITAWVLMFAALGIGAAIIVSPSCGQSHYAETATRPPPPSAPQSTHDVDAGDDRDAGKEHR